MSMISQLSMLDKDIIMRKNFIFSGKIFFYEFLDVKEIGARELKLILDFYRFGTIPFQKNYFIRLCMPYVQQPSWKQRVQLEFIHGHSQLKKQKRIDSFLKEYVNNSDGSFRTKNISDLTDVATDEARSSLAQRVYMLFLYWELKILNLISPYHLFIDWTRQGGLGKDGSLDMSKVDAHPFNLLIYLANWVSKWSSFSILCVVNSSSGSTYEEKIVKSRNELYNVYLFFYQLVTLALSYNDYFAASMIIGGFSSHVLSRLNLLKQFPDLVEKFNPIFEMFKPEHNFKTYREEWTRVGSLQLTRIPYLIVSFRDIFGILVPNNKLSASDRASMVGSFVIKWMKDIESLPDVPNLSLKDHRVIKNFLCKRQFLDEDYLEGMSSQIKPMLVSIEQRVLNTSFRTWKTEDVAFFLTKCKMERFAYLFQANDIDGSHLLDLTEEDLMSIGISDLFNCNQVLDLFKALFAMEQKFTSWSSLTLHIWYIINQFDETYPFLLDIKTPSDLIKIDHDYLIANNVKVLKDRKKIMAIIANVQLSLATSISNLSSSSLESPKKSPNIESPKKSSSLDLRRRSSSLDIQ